MAKSKEKIKAIALRKQGKSIKWIASELEVSPGSVSLWCRDVVLTEDQVSFLEKQGRDPHYGQRLVYAKTQQAKRIMKTNELMKEGVREVGKLSKRELLLVGTALYWAEGYKKDSQVGLGSSDPAMMKLYVKWLYDCFGLTKDDLLFRVTFNELHKYREKEIVSYWANVFQLTEDIFQKPFYQKAKWKKLYENPNDYYGVLRIRVRKSTDMLRKIKGYIQGMSQQHYVV
jgi:hypothetical protein